MNKLEDLEKRGRALLQEAEGILTILKEKTEIFERFGGREAIRINDSINRIMSLKIDMNRYLYKTTEYLRLGFLDADFIKDFDSCLYMHEGKLPELKKIASIQPAERAITPREAIAEIAKRDAEIAGLNEELEAKKRTVDHLNGIIEKRDAEINKLKKKVEILNDECDLSHEALSTFGVKYEDRLPAPPRKRI